MEAFNFDLQRFAGMVYDSIPPNISIEGTADSDTFDNKSHGVTIDAGDGNDSIKNDGAQVSIQGGRGNDSILNAFNGGLATIHGGKGDDYILNDGSHVVYVFERGDGNDTIEGFKSNNVLHVVGSAAAIVKNENNNHFMRYSGGEVTVKDQGNRPWHLTGIHGAHTFHNFIDGETLEGGDLNDTIINYGANNVVFKHFNGDGSDSIVGFNETSTLVLGKNSDRDDVEVYYKKHYTEEDILVGIYYSKPINQSVTADYTITLKGAASLTSVNIDGIDITPNDPYLVRLTKGDDTCDNTLNNATILAYGGADSVTNTGANVFVNGGKDNDFIFNDGGQKATIVGGKGNDTISLSETVQNNLIKYTAGDGSDSIIGFNSTTTLKIGNGESDTYASVKSGNDIFVTVGSAVITLVGAANSAGKILGKEITLVTLDDEANNYSNNNNDVMIWSFGGNDMIRNNAVHVTVDTGSGKNNIINNGAASSLAGGDDNDTIDNYASMVTITAGAGDDLVRNRANATMTEISTGDGNDTIDQLGTQGIIHAGKGNDRISLKGGYPTIGGANLIVYHEGDGNDVITGFGTQDTLMIVGVVNATCSTLRSGNGLSDVLVCVGNDTITLKSAASVAALNPGMIRSTIDPSIIEAPPEDTTPADNPSLVGNFTEGNDTYNNTVDAVAMLALGGDDSVTNSGASVTIDGMGGNDYIENSGASVSITGGADNDTIYNRYSGSNVTISGGAGNDSIYNIAGSNVSINGGAGNDTIYNSSGSNLSIDGGVGDDSIRNYDGNSATIDGGEGDDDIYNDGENVSITGGAGNDSIYNWGAYTTIDGGAGNDTIDSGNSYNTIYGGAGNDTIKISYSSIKNLIEYTLGDGNDLILGFDKTSTLKIGGGSGTYSTTKSGDNLFVCVGNDTITLVGAASLAGNIVGSLKTYTPVTPATKFIPLTENVDNYLTSIEGATIEALGGNDNLFNAFTDVSINAGTGNDSVTNFSSSVTIDGGTGNDSIVSGDQHSRFRVNRVLINAGDGNDSIRNNYSYNITVNGGAGNDSIYNHNVSNSTIALGDGDDSIYNSGHDDSINGGAGNDTISNWNSSSDTTINGGAGDDIINSSKRTLIEYMDGDGKDTVYGFGGDDTLKIGNGTTDTYSKATVDNDIIVTVGDGSILLKGAASLEAVNISGEDESSAADNWTLADGVANYKSLFTLSGINPNLTVDELDAAIEIDGNKIILSANALGKSDVTLTTTGDYTLALGDDCPTVTTVGKSWTLDGTTATYHDTGKTDGYKLTNTKTVTYTAATVGKALLTVNGVVDGLSEDDLNENLTVSGKVLTVTPEVVGENFSVGGGYKVVFSEGDYGNSTFTGTDGKDTIEVNGSGLQISLGAGNDTVTSNGDGGNTYLFSSTGGKDVVKGYGDDDTIKITDGANVTTSVKGSDIIVKAGTATMSLKGAATGTHLNVVDSADKTLIDETVYSDRIVVDDGATLLPAFNSTNFTAEDPIVKVDASAVARRFSLTGGDGDNTLIGGTGSNFINGGDGSSELTGGRGNDTFVAGNGVDTITDYGVGTDKISLAASISGFKFDGDDVIIGFDDDKSMTIANGAGKKIYFLQNGRSSTEIFDAGGKMNTAKTSITLSATTKNYTTNSSMLTIDGGLTDSVWIVGNAKANKIFGGSGSDTLNGKAGNDTLTGGDDADIFVYESGKDVVTDYVSGEDKISLTAAPISESLSAKGDVILKFSSANQLTIKGGNEILFVGDNDEVTKTYLSDRIVGDDGVTLQANFKTATFAADELSNVDGSATTAKVTLNGNDSDNVLIGGRGNNLINGNAGNDILIGNGGADTFVYSSGDDTITDYESKDKISLTSAIQSFDLSGDDVIIGFGDGSLMIADAANSAISFVETTNGKVTTNVNVFASDGIFNKAKTAVTLKPATESYMAAANVISIDGGLATGDVEIVGNAKSNKIHAGNNGSTIDGGSNNDSLWGGNGSDTFIYSGGNDVIYGFGNGDALNFSGDFTASVKSNSIAFKVGSTANAVTLKDYSATTFNVNGETYAISGSNFVKK